MRVLICGGGAIGASCAYFLARRGIEAVVIERTGVACAASGKSGGFLALDWCDGTPLQALARRSFALHASLPGEIGADWGHRPLDTFGGFGSARKGASAERRGGPGWLSERVTIDRRLGSAATTGQVHPRLFTEGMMRAAEALGASLRIGEVQGLVNGRGRARAAGVVVDGEVIAGDAIVIALGPWSALAGRWLPLPRVFGLKGHSLVFETGDRVPAEALFLEFEEAAGPVSSPEVFPRPDGTTYVCAISSDSPVPLDPADVAPDPGASERLEAICRSLSPALARAKIVTRQACFRPVTRDGLPLIGRIPGSANAYAATGHSVWGILNAPATGEAIAELIADGAAKSLDLTPFDPGRPAEGR